jgi:ribosome-binding ATPase YchF (GTP1/OBG family)
VKLNDEEYKLIRNYNLLTLKPMLYVANVAEDFAADPTQSPMFVKLQNYLSNSSDMLISISAQIEQEISQLDPEDQVDFLKELNLKESGLNTIVRSSFQLLNLSTYFTSGEMESRA